jgi:hypothetical protein
MTTRSAFKSLPAFRTTRHPHDMNIYGHIYRERSAAANASDWTAYRIWDRLVLALTGQQSLHSSKYISRSNGSLHRYNMADGGPSWQSEARAEARALGLTAG